MTADQLAADLRAATEHLAVHVQTRAQEVAAPRIAAAEERAAARVAEVEQRAAWDRERWAGLEAEFRRQLAVQERIRNQLIDENKRLKQELAEYRASAPLVDAAHPETAP